MKILVAGKGGREHAIVTALKESASAPEVYCYPGSDAILQIAQPAPGVSDVDSMVAFMVEQGIDLCIGGEESYLALGLADKARAAGIPTFGPVQASAQLEASKEFAKQFMVKHDIPTAGYAAVDTYEEAKAAITVYPVVLKFDGLAAGKGVAVCSTEAEADEFLKEVMVDRRFGEGRMVIEECLTGPEVSVISVVSDGEYQIFTPARDYKRLGDGDEGPNTGGMGAVASRVLIDDAILKTIEDTVVRPSVEGLVADAMDFRGFLYCGLMLTPDGPKMLEYNCRFGDPEAQAVLPLVQGDFAEYLFLAAKGEPDPSKISFDDSWSICLVLASAGYPASSRNGDVISGLEEVEGARVYHAGTKLNSGGAFETNGGRVLAVVARGESRGAALEKATLECSKVDFDGSQRRGDIGRLHFES